MATCFQARIIPRRWTRLRESCFRHTRGGCVLRGIWDRLTAGIVSFGEFWGTKEDVEERLAYNFNKAKTLSDFIGMIVRFAFANFAVAYFIKRSAEVRGFEGYVLGFCATMSAGLLLVFGASLVR